MTKKKTENIQNQTSPPKRNWTVLWSNIDAFGSIFGAVVSAFALFVGIYQFMKQTEELKYEREQRIKLDRPILSIDKNLVYDFKRIKQVKLVIKNVGVRPAYNLQIRTIVLCRNDKSSPLVYNQKNYSVIFSNPIFNEQEVNFVNNLGLVKNAEFYIKVNLQYFEENEKGSYDESFYFKWTHTDDPDFLQSALYGIEKELSVEIDDFIKMNNNKL